MVQGLQTTSSKERHVKKRIPLRRRSSRISALETLVQCGEAAGKFNAGRF